MEDWAEIRRLHRAEGMPVKAIARVMRISRNTVRAAIAERIGWDRSVRVLRARVTELRPAYLPPDPASRTAYAAGEVAQRDFWFPPVMVPAGCGQVRKPVQLPVLTMVCAYSRWLSALLIPTRTTADLFAGWWQRVAVLRRPAEPQVQVRTLADYDTAPDVDGA